LNTPADPSAPADLSAASTSANAAASSADPAAPPAGDARDGHEDLSAAVPILAQNPLLGSFGPDDWRAFTHYLERVTFPAATDVVREASEGQEMYFILAGIAHLRRAHIDLGTIGRGDHFGELALIARRLRAASVVTITRLVTARLSRERYEALSAEHPSIALRFTQALVASLGVRLTEMTDSVGLLLRERSLPRRTLVEVRVGGELRKVRTGTIVKTLLPDEVTGAPVVACLLNQKAVSLNTPVTSECTLTALTTDHWEGKRVYRHSLGLLLLEAAHRVDPESAVRLGPSFGFGQDVELTPSPTLDQDTWASRVTAVLHGFIDAAAGFRQELWAVEEARSHFEENGSHDAALLLRAWRDPAVTLASAGELYALSMTPLLPDASAIKRFFPRLEPGARGFVLYYGDEAQVTPAEVPPPDAPKPEGAPKPAEGLRLPPRRVQMEEEPFLSALGVTSVGAFNEACILGSVSQIIRVSEGLHEKRIGQIADVIVSRAGRTRVVCIAGPSSSGKTTFIKRLMVQLQVNGIQPVGISLDDYYKDREKTVRTPDGDYDFEALEALDIPLLHAHLARLVRGEEVTTARYDFTRGVSMPEGGPAIKIAPSDMLMLEGIHGLNPRLLAAVLDRSQIFRVFIQPTASLPFDRLTRVNVSDVRLLRRIVRDRHHRGTNAGANILRWPAVRAGERAHIFPYIDQADAVFDSALVYELSVIKVFADRYLLEVPQDHPAKGTAHRLRQLIDRFITIYPDHVPPTSILREFIGGSGFEY
jgi:uridine kinase